MKTSPTSQSHLNASSQALTLATVSAGSSDGIDHVNNPHPRCPCAILMDTSSSMAGTPIGEAAKGLDQFFKEVAADSVASLRLETLVLGFGGDVREIVPFGQKVSVSCNEGLGLLADGDTPLGEAVTSAIKAIESRRSDYLANNLGAYNPWLIILSDGYPTDTGWEQAADRLRLRAVDHGWNVISVAIGENANVGALQRFSRLKVQRLNGLRFAEFFSWLSDSLKIVSRSSTSAQNLAVPPTNSWSFNA